MQPKIVEHTEIVRVLDYLPEKKKDQSALVIFDIDNTLLEPKTMITSTEWFEHSLEKMLAQGISQKEAFAQLLDLCAHVQDHVVMKNIEPSSQALVEQVKETGAQVLGLTSRAPVQAQKTVEQLAKFGFDLTSSLFKPVKELLSPDAPYYYHQGVIFCYFYSKGYAFTEILERLDYRPNKIIFVDDVVKNLQVMEQALHDFDQSIDFTGIHYTRLAYKKGLFDPAIAERELAMFKTKGAQV